MIANTIARKKLYEINRIISDTAEYGCYLFNHACKPLLQNFVDSLDKDIIGQPCGNSNDINSETIEKLDVKVKSHPIEEVGSRLRLSMTQMKKLELN